MTKQGEIREGIDMKKPIPQILNRMILGILIKYKVYTEQNPLAPNYIPLDTYIAEAIADSMYELSEAGVVIKVEIPELTACEACEYYEPESTVNICQEPCIDYCCWKLKADYTAFLPLIEESK